MCGQSRKWKTLKCQILIENIDYKNDQTQVWILSWKLEGYCLGLFFCRTQFSAFIHNEVLPEVFN